MSAPLTQKQPLLPLVAFLVLLIVATLTLFAMLFSQPAIETDLLQRTRQSLSEAGLPADGVRFQGRDGILTGSVTDENMAGHLVDIVSRVSGVRTVANHLVVVSSVPVESSIPETPTPVSKDPHQPSQKYPIEQVDLSVIHFDYSKAELDPDATAALDEVTALLLEDPKLKIEVSAHTDDTGTALGNMAVTQARAEAIRNYLLSKGIKAEQVTAQGYGSVRPVAENNTAEGREKNRRVEITVLEE